MVPADRVVDGRFPLPGFDRFGLEPALEAVRREMADAVRRAADEHLTRGSCSEDFDGLLAAVRAATE